MKKFWKKSLSNKSLSKVGSPNALNVSVSSSSIKDNIFSTNDASSAETRLVAHSRPTRHQRMQLLNAIIHHADAVQNLFLSPKSSPPSENNSGGNILSRGSSSVSACVVRNDKAYERFHQVLQEGLVPMAVRGLGLLETDGAFRQSLPLSNDPQNDEEEEYFASLDGMEVEIQTMAILARAASLRARSDSNGKCLDEEQNGQENVGISISQNDGMGQINAMMKCATMLMFHIVMMASTPSSNPNDSTVEVRTNNGRPTTAVASYDGRVRHVLKMACVDVFTTSIINTVESFERIKQDAQSPSSFNVDECNLRNVASMMKFLDEYNIGKDAIFGTVWTKKPASSDKPESLETSSELIGMKLGSDSEPQTVVRNNEITPLETLKDSDDSLKNIADIPFQEENKPYNQHKHGESVSGRDHGSNTADSNENGQSLLSNRDPKEEPTKSDSNYLLEKCENTISAIEILQPDQPSDFVQENKIDDNPSLKQEEEADLLSKRHLNSKFLATRKFELIERMVAIEVVRFLLAEERERKLRDKELKEQNTFKKMAELLRRGGEDEGEGDASPSVSCSDPHAEASEEPDDSNAQSDQNDKQIPSDTDTDYWNSERIRRIKRGLKIAGVGLTLGTVFAVTGGLAAPALAAGLGGLASLTGAGTASSTAILAVLATFKAGAALFGVGGGGIAAYKMKKRTDGLSEFSIRRENIEQCMYQGASEDKMKKGVEAMLPHLHTTVAVSGWLRENDVDDFQLAWGICPNSREDKSKDDVYRIRQLKRFYSVHNPKLVEYCEDFMWHLQRQQKKEFSWDKIWNQIERKYGSNPDHILPMDNPYDNEISLSLEERDMINGVLNDAKIVVGKRRGFSSGDVGFDESDEIAEFFSSVSPSKSKSLQPTIQDDLETTIVEKMEVKMMTENITPSKNQCAKKIKQNAKEVSLNSSAGVDDETGNDEVRLKETNTTIKDHNGNSDPTDSITLTSDGEPKQSTENDVDDQPEQRCPVVWDWTRLYGTDLHTVTWESKMLGSLCHIVENIAMEVSSQATKFALQYSLIGAILAAVAIPSSLLTATKLIDDPYQIVVIRADEAGRELARCLLLSDERRPVTLVGFSFGARVVYSCLRELARQQEIWEQERSQGLTECANTSSKSIEKPVFFEYDREPASLIADVIFIGLPRVIDKEVLTSCRRVTGGRLVNCYTRNDWLLSLMFLARGGTPCGAKPVLDIPGIENYDVTSLVESHTRYGDAIPNILKMIRFCEP